MQKNRAPQQISTWQRIKSITFPILLLLWLFYLPLALVVYTPFSYQLNCVWNERCERLGIARTERSIQDITHFFQHRQTSLQRPWTPKEQQHLSEVRDIYDKVLVLFIFISFLFLVDWIRTPDASRQYHRYARNSLILSGCLLLMALFLIPFFKHFWMNVFHPLLFDNELWRTNPRDISWYLMPKTFFLRLIIFISVCTLVLNLLAWWLSRKAAPAQMFNNR